MSKKKVTLLFVLAAPALLLSSCGSNDNPSSQGGKASGDEEKTTLGPAPTYSEESVQIHYLMDSGDYSKKALWLWDSVANAGKQFAFNGFNEVGGGIAAYKLSDIEGCTPDSTLGIIFKPSGEGDWTGQTSDILVTLADYPADANKIHHIYFKEGDETPYINSEYKVLDTIKTATWYTSTIFYAELSNPFSSWNLKKNGEVIASGEPTVKNQKIVKKDFSGVEGFNIDFTAEYTFEVTFIESKATLSSKVSFQRLYGTESFNATYAYDGDDLGAVYSASKTTFKVWSPFSSSMTLRLYKSGTPLSVDAVKGDDEFEEITMTKGEKGVWMAEVDGNLEGKYYTYFVKNGTYTQGIEVVDPYAKAAGVNGVRGMIVDFAKTNPSGWNEVAPINYDRKELSVYETHVVDLTSSSSWSSDASAKKKAKTYEGAYLSGTTYTEGDTTVKTGFDHIKELGVNAVQLQPIFDAANDEVHTEFNWGYNPLNYNVLEGSYSSDPFDGYARIKEFKSLVKAYHDAGINIIMDVVYNHVNAAKGSNFDVLAPGYYFRYDSKGALSNGSGCGNETASDHFMMRKFIKESTEFWASEYKLGGFRFDLMGLHDLETMNELVANLKKKTYDNIVVYGEPWTGGTSSYSEKTGAQKYIADFQGYGAFNDKIRDSLIKGGMSATSERGWATESASPVSGEGVGYGIKGYTGSDPVSTLTTDPNKSVVYASCHDNYTLSDRVRLAYSTDGGATTSASEEQLHYMPLLANSVVLTSQGTSFMLAGEEFLRTKTKSDGTCDGNSYNASYEENALDYSLKVKNADIFVSYQKLISLKTGVDGLHLEKEGCRALEVKELDNGGTLIYTITDSKNGKEYKIVHANGVGSHANVDFSGYDLYLDTRGELTSLSSSTPIKSLDTVIGVKALNA